MKILVATGLYAPDIGGPATYTAFLERHLPERGYELTVVPFTRVRKYPKLVRHLLYTYQLIRKGRHVDVLYALDPVSVGVPACIASIVLQKPLCLRVPGDYAWEQGQSRYGITATLDEYLASGARPFPVRLLAFLERLVASRARAIIVPSEYMKGVVTTWGVPREKIRVIHSAVHPVTIDASRDELRARFRYEGFVILTAARLVPWKGIQTLIDAVAALRARGILASLDVIGDGILGDELAAHIGKYDASAYMHLRGRESKTILAERIKAADAFVLNTAYEGLSHQLLEVMDIGTPLVTTPVGGNPEIITDGETGLLVPFNDRDAIVGALERLRTDTGLRVHLIERARARVRAFDEARIVHEIVEFFTNTWSALAKRK